MGEHEKYTNRTHSPCVVARSPGCQGSLHTTGRTDPTPQLYTRGDAVETPGTVKTPHSAIRCRCESEGCTQGLTLSSHSTPRPGPDPIWSSQLYTLPNTRSRRPSWWSLLRAITRPQKASPGVVVDCPPEGRGGGRPPRKSTQTAVSPLQSCRVPDRLQTTAHPRSAHNPMWSAAIDDCSRRCVTSALPPFRRATLQQS